MTALVHFQDASKNYASTAGRSAALKPLSFQLFPGEVIGCIGKNGSGKSTMLKLAAGITNPTTGSVTCNGNIRTMLELGAGLHHDLSGFENMYLLASIHGYSKKRVKAMVPVIQSFSGLSTAELNQRIKTYSTGMNLRLAFSTVVHLEADILLLDEVFAVGDLAFQEKCIEKLRALKSNGTAMLVAGHNLNIISELADRMFWLEDGSVVDAGEPHRVVKAYHSAVNASAQ